MSSYSGKRDADCFSVEDHSTKLRRGVATIPFCIKGFKDRKEKRDEFIESPIVEGLGYKWKIEVYPRGNHDSPTDEEHISCYLFLREGQCFIKSTWNINEIEKPNSISTPMTFNAGRGWGLANFFPRKQVLEKYLEDDGSLEIKIDIELSTTWYPEWPLRLALQDTPHDILFSMGETLYRIPDGKLLVRAKELYEIAEAYDDDDCPISIDFMSEDIFKIIVDYICSQRFKEEVIKNKDVATELLVAADRCGCVFLKLCAESAIVEKFLAAGNAAELLIFADSHSCALMKEAATNVFVNNLKSAARGEAWSRIKESDELLLELLSYSKKQKEDKQTNEIDKLDVTSLRLKLEDAKLEVDGGREVLVDRLKAYRQGQVRTNN